MTGTSRVDLADLNLAEYACYVAGVQDGRNTRSAKLTGPPRELRYTSARPSGPRDWAFTNANRPAERTEREGWAYSVGHMDGQDDVIADSPPGVTILDPFIFWGATTARSTRSEFERVLFQGRSVTVAASPVADSAAGPVLGPCVRCGQPVHLGDAHTCSEVHLLRRQVEELTSVVRELDRWSPVVGWPGDELDSKRGWPWCTLCTAIAPDPDVEESDRSWHLSSCPWRRAPEVLAAGEHLVLVEGVNDDGQ